MADKKIGIGVILLILGLALYLWKKPTIALTAADIEKVETEKLRNQVIADLGADASPALVEQVVIVKQSDAYQRAVVVAQEMAEIAAAGGNPQWDYHPGGVGVTAREMAAAGINPDMGVYGQDIYQAHQLTGAAKEAYAEASKTLGIQESLLAAGVMPYAPL